MSADSAILWHNRYGHLNYKSLGDLANKRVVDGISMEMVANDVECKTCIRSKICSQPFATASKSRSENLLELIHTDVCGPMKIPSIGSSRYYVTFIDDMSRIRHKNEVFEKFKIFKLFVENQTDRKIKAIE